MEKNTFCIISPDFFEELKGGSPIQSYFLGRELVRRKWIVHFIRENEKKKGVLETKNGMIVHSLPHPKASLTWLNIFRLFKMMKKIKARYWYCRSARAYIFAVWLLSKVLGGKVLWACSSDIHITKELGKKTENENILVRLILKFDKLLFILALKKIDFVLLQTQSQKKLLKENWDIKGVVVRNGYPILNYVKRTRKPFILWIGNLRRMKRPEKFVHVAKYFQEKTYEFFLIGKEMGFPELREYIREADKISNNFFYLGGQNSDQIYELLQQAKLLIHTSDYEGFPNVFIEAWLCGVPVISLKVDPDDLIKIHNLGRISHSIEKMENDIQEIMSNHSLWNELSNNVKTFAKENFDIKKSVDSLLRYTRR